MDFNAIGDSSKADVARAVSCNRERDQAIGDEMKAFWQFWGDWITFWAVVAVVASVVVGWCVKKIEES